MPPWLTQALATIATVPAAGRLAVFFQLVDNEMRNGSGITNPFSITAAQLAYSSQIETGLTAA